MTSEFETGDLKGGKPEVGERELDDEQVEDDWNWFDDGEWDRQWEEWQAASAASTGTSSKSPRCSGGEEKFSLKEELAGENSDPGEPPPDQPPASKKSRKDFSSPGLFSPSQEEGEKGEKRKDPEKDWEKEEDEDKDAEKKTEKEEEEEEEYFPIGGQRWSWPSSPLFEDSWLLPSPSGQSSTQKSRASRGRRHKGSSSSAAAAAAAATDLSTLSWSELTIRHNYLMDQKGRIDSRKFNKSALELLNAFAAKSRTLASAEQSGAVQRQTPAAAANKSGVVDPWASEKEALKIFRAKLLNKKDVASEELVARVVEYIQTQLPPFMTADERKETLLKKSLSFVLELSPQISLKTAPVIRSYVNRLFDAQLDNLFAEIRMPEMPVRQKALLYRRMFSRFLDDDRCVSFAATNKPLLGKLAIRDLFFLTFYASVTSKRHRSDNLLQLGCTGTRTSDGDVLFCSVASVCPTSPTIRLFVFFSFFSILSFFLGRSSVGKSLLFESLLLICGHQLLTATASGSSDSGCGRYSVG